jgi:hypothetical protein
MRTLVTTRGGPKFCANAARGMAIIVATQTDLDANRGTNSSLEA